ncbi:hypothetical protein COUCH_00475 [Couchioplanes caeruleus]|uniref:hypothetical protein n=1 Tax=Couchioplanes caeruleus TaxID=56438 RepID=UPI0020C176A9|nr:hypothetical protein [Couchioplanes caeruleus]UQU64878.1 hypothetical protein COUCH_00475 [Couchioplanes caeruleus]
MSEQEKELFAQEIIRRVAALAWEEQRAHVLAYLTSARPATATTAAPSAGGNVVDLAARRARRRAA